MKNVYFIGENSSLLKNLEEIFPSHAWNIIYITSKKRVNQKPENYFRIISKDKNGFIAEMLGKTELIHSIDGLVIFGSDYEMRQISESNCPIWVKEKLLPTKNELGFSIPDSKVGLARVLTQLKIKSPKQYVFSSMSDIDSQKIPHEMPWLLKGDAGGGGSKVLDINRLDLQISEQKNIGFPFVVQEKIQGQEICVEAFYWEGSLTGFIYNTDIRNISRYGPSYARTVTNPENQDFRETLVSLGKHLEISGLVNCTFMLESNSMEHFLVEFDPRPNVWHHLAKYLGLDVSQLFNVDKSNTLQSPEGSTHVLSLDRYLQFLEKNINFKNFSKLIEYVFSKSIYVLESPDASIIFKLRFVVKTLGRRAVFNLAKYAFRKSPKSFQELIKTRGYTLRLTRFILGH